MDTKKKLSVAFLYPQDVGKEYRDFKAGLVPSHRLWGFVELENMGWRSLMCPPAPRLLATMGGLGWRLWQSGWVWVNRRKIDAVFSIHEVSALFCLYLRLAGVLGVPVVVLNFGLLHPKNLRGIRKRIWRIGLSASSRVVSLVSRQVSALVECLGVPENIQHHVALGVDVPFMRAHNRGHERGEENSSPKTRFILAVGTNEGKDYETLLEALPLGERLVVVTDNYNARLISAHRCFGLGVEVLTRVPYQKLLSLYRDAELVVIPLHDRLYGSGHTVFLETLSLGKKILVSASSGMVGYANGGVNCVTVPVGDVGGLRRGLQWMLDHPLEAGLLARTGWVQANAEFLSQRFAELFARILSEVLKGGYPADGDAGASEASGLEKHQGLDSSKENQHASI